MTESRKILIFSINGKLFLRENQQKVGYFKPKLHGFELIYRDEILRINEKQFGDTKLITFRDRSYLFQEDQVFSWPNKIEKYHFKGINGMKSLFNLNKEKISKIKCINEINYLEILNNVSDFITILFLNLYFLINN